MKTVLTNKALIMRCCLYIPAFVLLLVLLPIALDAGGIALEAPNVPMFLRDVGHGLGAVAITSLIVGLYGLPTIVAFMGSHHNVAAICMLNLLLGWTVLGWIAALIWAMTVPAPPAVLRNNRLR